LRERGKSATAVSKAIKAVQGPLLSATSNSASIAGLPFCDIVLRFGQLGDVERGVAVHDERLSAGSISIEPASTSSAGQMHLRACHPFITPGINLIARRPNPAAPA